MGKDHHNEPDAWDRAKVLGALSSFSLALQPQQLAVFALRPFRRASSSYSRCMRLELAKALIIFQARLSPIFHCKNVDANSCELPDSACLHRLAVAFNSSAYGLEPVGDYSPLPFDLAAGLPRQHAILLGRRSAGTALYICLPLLRSSACVSSNSQGSESG